MLSVIIFWSRKDCIRAQYQIFYYLWLSRETRSGCPEELNCFMLMNRHSALEIQLSSRQLPSVLPRQTDFIVITSAKRLPRWLFPSKIYIQFTIVNTYFSTKLSLTNKRYHLHVPEMCLYVLQEVRSVIMLSSFSSFTWQRIKLCFHVLYHRIGEIL